MTTMMQIARNSCRGTLWKVLQSRPQTLHRNFGSPLTQKISKLSRNHVALLSTSQSLSTVQEHDHSHSKLWTAERFLSASLVGILPLSLAFPNPVLDYALALTLTLHVHWGVEAIVVDYVRPNIVGAALSKAAIGAVYALSALTLGGLFYFNYSDVGLGQAIRMLWKL